MSRSSAEYEPFYAHYSPFVTSYVARRLRASAVEDLVAEVFVVALRRLADVPDDALPWLYRTAHHLIGNRYRSDDRLAALREKLASVPAESPDDPAGRAVDREQLAAAFAALDESDRELVLLACWEGLTSAEIAQVMGLSAGAVRVRIHRARKRMLIAIEERAAAMGSGVAEES